MNRIVKLWAQNVTSTVSSVLNVYLNKAIRIRFRPGTGLNWIFGFGPDQEGKNDPYKRKYHI